MGERTSRVGFLGGLAKGPGAALLVLGSVFVASCAVGDGWVSPEGEFCVAELQAGEWDDDALSWWDVGPQGEDIRKASPWQDIQPHHAYLVAVHAAHLPSGNLILFHGQGEQRVWPIGEAATAMRWHPLPFEVPQSNPNLCSYPPVCPPEFCPPEGPPPRCFADIFCSGHVVLPDGRFFVAGGNVNNGPGGGGLQDLFLFDPEADGYTDENVPPFGWTKSPATMVVDRWYPTATVIPRLDPQASPLSALGRVLIVSGATRTLGGATTPIFELYDPANETVTELNIAGNSPFEGDIQIPTYPFMFLLPNGDIFYAGGEYATEDTRNGRVLIPDYNNNGTWAWHDRIFESTIPGGSAAMYAPGKIIKSGGPTGLADDLAHRKTETIDLSDFASGDYANAPDFTLRSEMAQRRHFHTLTLLPDGRVVATGGNTRSNGADGDNEGNPCEFPPGDGNPLISEMACNDMDRDGAPDYPATPPLGCPAVPSVCEGENPAMQQAGTCPLRVIDGMPVSCFEDFECGAPCSIEDDCPPGSSCNEVSGHCEMPCGPGTCGAVVHCTGGGTYCDPANNQCQGIVTKTAEIYDPDCGTWAEFDAQENPRMYHSTALLLPDGSVLSTGGGHGAIHLDDQATAQIFRPEYGTGPAPNIEVVGPTNMPFSHPVLPWNGEAQVMLSNGDLVQPERFTLVRLGSATHGFDMDQRWMKLEMNPTEVAIPTQLTVKGPQNTAVGLAAFSAPPGHYMLFLRSETGEVSEGQYVKVGPGSSGVFACPASPGLDAMETSCLVEPIGGQCPVGSTRTNDVALPRVMGSEGPIDGWHVLVPAGDLADHGRGLQRPSARELATINARCVAACEAQYESDPAVAANCADPGAFGEPFYYISDAPGPYDLVLPSQKRGQEVFTGESLACDLDSTCCSVFDEDLCAATPDRTTPANDMLRVGEEYLVALGMESEVEIITNAGSYSSELTGSVGYSFCPDGSGSGPCPFYLGSFEARTTSAITASMRCADNTTAQAEISSLFVKLSQPAFGIASGESSDEKGFPKGGLIFESEIDVGPIHIAKRRPSTADVVISAEGVNFDASDLIVSMTVPCNTSTASITARLTVRDPGDGSALGKPPAVTNTTATSGGCGRARDLTASVSDPDRDAGPVRWKVDGVLMAPGTSSMIVRGAHTLEAVVRDSRGATTTARKEISCF